MAFFKANVSEEAVKESGGGSGFIGTSGIYDVIVKRVSVDTSKNGSQSLSFTVQPVDNPQGETTLYGLTITNKDGSQNFKAEIFNRFIIIAGIETVDDPVEQTFKVGKDQQEKTLAVFPQFEDFACKVRVQEEYSLYNGELRKAVVIKTFYSTEGATAEELVNGTDKGVKLAKDEVYASNVTYRDGLTAETVKEMQDAAKAGNAPTKAAPVVNKPAGSLFK